ncbi:MULTISPECIES: hypothetical protein [Bacillus]|uniref:Acetyltransferase n=2 Tax=Bacillus paranthracis TaxID=2026186 RepID=A0AAX3QHD9_9BACI|nr:MULTISPECIES: hypothetical protein [Bacillus]MCD9104112.1 hypothetical protein [Bacillus sp. PLB03]MDG0881735.1 hypothetical protein [Bacillus paranthracis]MDX5874842.1 hypothetical protein [Bacillus cereus group sp. BfR-BA-01344]MDX5886217.1 hypothetical protein [Bacillus cereus group sp. BfR-BA-00999]MEB9454183.1 hypothetical protein [Bacillus anthracis]
MSRHYRLIGMNKLTKHRKGLKQRIRREKDIYLNENTEIVSVRKDLEEISVLDPTFVWHRNDELFGNCVEFGGDEFTFGTMISVKGWCG